MTAFIAWCGFFGAWLLVAGPIYQAAVELSDEEFQDSRVRHYADEVPPPKRVSYWWWLVPPVHYVKTRRLVYAYRQQMLAVLGPEDLKVMVSFQNKATGWLFVGAGGLLLALKETWELHERYELPTYAYWLICVAAFAVGVAVAAMRTSRGRSMIAEMAQAKDVSAHAEAGKAAG